MPKQIVDESMVGDILHQWTIQEYEQHSRGTIWYMIMTILGLFLVVFGMISGNFLFALVIVLFGIILFLQSHQEPLQVLFQITELGVVVGNRFYSYSELDSFYIIYNPPEVKTLYIDLKNAFRPRLKIPLLDNNPIEIKHALREFLLEDDEKEDEPLSDRAARNWQIH